ncbi:MAG TPA: hypothetical protein VGM23_01355 [Armatimonadota bacterium]|jgi:hypothetical protein
MNDAIQWELCEAVDWELPELAAHRTTCPYPALAGARRQVDIDG